MTQRRQLTFWLVTLVVFGFLLWLLRDVLLPFVTGIALAYLQTPLADRLERRGVNRTVAALLIVGGVVVAVILVGILLTPILVQQGAALVAALPGFAERLQALVSDPGPPWLRSLLPEGDGGKATSDLVAQGTRYLTALLSSLWSGGRALASFISVLVIMPVVTFYLICDWHKMINTLDGWVPPQSRKTVRRLAREIDAAISGFVRGQAAVCVIAGCYYALALTLIGLKFGLDRPRRRGADVPALCGLARRSVGRGERGGCAVLAAMGPDRGRGRRVSARRVRRGQCAGPQARG